MASVPATADAATCDEGQVAPPAGNGYPKNRLPDAVVQFILSRERQKFAPDPSDYPPDIDETLRRGTEAFKILSDSFAEFQEEVRAEYEAKGYVEVDDDFFQRSEEERQSMREEFADLFDGIDLSNVPFSDRYYKTDKSEGEEDIYYNFEEEDESESEEEDEDEQEGPDNAQQEGAEDDSEENDDKQEAEDDSEENEDEQKGAEDEEISPGCKST